MTLETLTTITVLAVVVEFATEVIKNLIPPVRKEFSKVVAIILGVVLCLSTGTGILNLFGLAASYPLADYLVSGLIISRGSNIIHDLVAQLNKTTKTA